jgi:hypothetical protein
MSNSSGVLFVDICAWATYKYPTKIVGRPQAPCCCDRGGWGWGERQRQRIGGRVRTRGAAASAGRSPPPRSRSLGALPARPHQPPHALCIAHGTTTRPSQHRCTTSTHVSAAGKTGERCQDQQRTPATPKRAASSSPDTVQWRLVIWHVLSGPTGPATEKHMLCGAPSPTPAAVASPMKAATMSPNCCSA